MKATDQDNSQNLKSTCSSTDTSSFLPKRLERKQGRRMFLSPKSKLENQKQRVLNQNQNQNVPSPNRPSILDIQSLGRTICYVSPKNMKNGQFLSPAKNFKITENESFISIDEIKSKQFIDFQNQMNEKHDELNSRKISKVHSHKKFKSELFTDNFQKCQNSNDKAQCRGIQKQEIKMLKLENNSLYSENRKLKLRISELEEQNSSLQQTVQTMKNRVQQLNSRKHEVIMLNQSFSQRIKDHENYIFKLEKDLKDSTKQFRNYDILTHLYKRIQDQLQFCKNNNKDLILKNKKLERKVATLINLLQDTPDTPQKQQKITFLPQQSDCFRFDFECSSNEKIQCEGFITPRSNVNQNLKDMSIFQLTPE